MIKSNGTSGSCTGSWKALHPLSEADVAARTAELLFAEGARSEGQLPKNVDRRGVTRVLSRLGLPQTTKDLLEHVPRMFRSGLLERASAHSKAQCTELAPTCGKCTLVSFCRTGQRRRQLSNGGATAIDLFAGAGALSFGFAQEGFDIRAAVELNRHAAQTFRHNHPGVAVFEADVRRVLATELLQVADLKPGELDCVVAGPPCQGFSAAGLRNPRAGLNKLYRSVADFACAVRSKAIVMENVPGLRSVRGVDFEERIVSCFEERGYETRVFTLDSSEYGVPQKRARIVFIGIRDDLDGTVRKPVRRRVVPTVLDALRGLPPLKPGEGADVYKKDGTTFFNHRAMAHSPEVVAKIRGIRGGEGPISYRRLHNEIARTIIAGHRAMPVHPTEHRTITVREAARLQTLPDDFRVLGPHAHQPLQVANAVPYELARSLARCVKTMLRAQ